MSTSKWLCMIPVLLSSSGCTMLTSRGLEDNVGWPVTQGGIQYSLPKSLIKVKLSKLSDNTLQITMEQPTYVADPQHTYLLRYETSPFSSDNFDVEVDPKTGFLTKVDMTAEDKLGDIIVQIAKTVATLETSDQNGETVIAERMVDPTDESALCKLQTAQ